MTVTVSHHGYSREVRTPDAAERERYLAGFSPREREDYEAITGRPFPVKVFVRSPSCRVPRARKAAVKRVQGVYEVKEVA